MGSWNNLTGRLDPLDPPDPFLHSSAIRTKPGAISFTKLQVGVANLRRITRSDHGSFWTAKLTWPFFEPKRVPVTTCPSVTKEEVNFEGRASHWQAGTEIAAKEGPEHNGDVSSLVEGGEVEKSGGLSYGRSPVVVGEFVALGIMILLNKYC
ncbi:hypothetical protein Scep_014059 [Stephania cephalantha]|uniref:Uncharacterized protein n=1 Tax=Stephania cephalantha TaxID=152367 RepID=A0AAP0P003_9MAGN